MVYIADFADFLKIKQETIRKCHTCSELHQAAPLNCSGGMHLCLSVTSTLLLEKKKKSLRNSSRSPEEIFKSHSTFKNYLCAFPSSAQSPLTQLLSLIELSAVVITLLLRTEYISSTFYSLNNKTTHISVPFTLEPGRANGCA